MAAKKSTKKTRKTTKKTSKPRKSKKSQQLTEALVRRRLQGFFENNEISEVDSKNPKFLRIKHPWGDRTVALDVDLANLSDLAASINSIYLPHRLSALYHTRTKELEIIWTAMRLSESQEATIGRKFDFTYKNKIHSCEFQKASKPLLTLAEHCVQIEPTSDTYFRNLNTFQWYLSFKKSGDGDFPKLLDEPRSLKITNVPSDHSHMVDLCVYLNFYMSYYDTRSPIIYVHSPEEEHEPYKSNRYKAGSFPSKIEAEELDENLLWFWNNLRVDIQARYLDCFKILEYCAFHYLANEAKADIKKILSEPALKSHLDASIEEIVGIISVNHSKYENKKFEQFFETCFSVDLVWPQIEKNRSLFSKTYKFDGGYQIKPLIQNSDQKGQFKNKGLSRLAQTLRELRNVLSHGRDAGSNGVIRPTSRNFQLLRPWTRIIEFCASEAILYRHLT